MTIIGYDKLCIGSYSAINELVIIIILCYQSKMIINILKNRSMQSSYCLNDVVSNFTSSLF